jgi:hypothetical protein
MAKTRSTTPPNLHIGGDLLAMDRGLRRLIETEARALEARFPNQSILWRVQIAEEFDPARGHRIRCEIDATPGERRQIVVREFRKEAREAITHAFASAGTQLQRLRRRSMLPLGKAQHPAQASGNTLSPAGA